MMRALICLAALAVVACVSQAEREAEARAELSKEIDRVCSLPKAEREVALEKLKKESGMVLVCGADKN